MAVREGFHHVALRVKDIDTTIAFYEALGCRLNRTWVRDGSRNCMIDMGGGNPRFEHISFKSSDPDADFAAAVAAGARPRTEPKDVAQGDHHARVAFVYGPDDEIVEFFMAK